MTTSSPFLGIISGQRRRGHAEVADRTDRIASGLHQLGIKPGDSVCMLMRNDIAFIEAAYAAMRLGAYMRFLAPDARMSIMEIKMGAGARHGGDADPGQPGPRRYFAGSHLHGTNLLRAGSDELLPRDTYLRRPARRGA